MPSLPGDDTSFSQTLYRIFNVALIGVVIGVIASLCAVFFVEAIKWLNDLLLISPRSRMIARDNETLLLVATIVVPAVGGLLVGFITQKLIKEKRPHGPADAIIAVQNGSGEINPKSGLLTALAGLISLGSGASVGQYGPLAHLGATIGAIVRKTGLSMQARGSVTIGCGVAAAISTVFNAPIAGIVFAHEVILRHFSLRAFAPITVASTVGFVFANVVFQRAPLFRIDTLSVGHALEFVPFAVIGVLGALVAVTFMRAILFSGKLASRTPIPAQFKPMLAGALLGIAAIFIPDILGIGKETLRFAIIEDAFSFNELAVLVVAKIAATALCIGFGFAGGVFSPALLIGILFGALVGTGMDLLAGDWQSGIAVYAVCGMVAVTSPVIGAPLTTILIVFELTRNYDLTTAAMVSAVFSNLVSYGIFGRSLFDKQLLMRGFDLRYGPERIVMGTRVIKSHVVDNFIQLKPSDSLAKAKNALLENNFTEAYVLDENHQYMGTMMLNRIVHLENEGQDVNAEVGSYAEKENLILTADTSIWSAMERMRDFVGESIPVITSADDNTFVGIVYEANIVDAYIKTIHDLREDENAAG